MLHHECSLNGTPKRGQYGKLQTKVLKTMSQARAMPHSSVPVGAMLQDRKLDCLSPADDPTLTSSLSLREVYSEVELSSAILTMPVLPPGPEAARLRCSM